MSSEDELRALRAELDAQKAVLARVKQYVSFWLQDRRMKVSGEILLKEIARYEREESERATRDAR